MSSSTLQLRLMEVNRQADFGSAFRLVTSIPGPTVKLDRGPHNRRTKCQIGGVLALGRCVSRPLLHEAIFLGIFWMEHSWMEIFSWPLLDRAIFLEFTWMGRSVEA